MQYAELLDLLPLQEQGKMDLGLATMTQVMDLLGKPQDQVPMVHIAGTNGKGSAAAFTERILREAGYKVGLYISPSLVEFNERIQINGQATSDDQLLKAVKTLSQALEGTSLCLTEFELFTALAFLTFQDQACDIAVVEVGLGGRLDATNVISRPAVTAITKIGMDHTAFLGDSLPEIAGEKAAIAKPGSPMVVYPQGSEVTRVIQDQADRVGAPLTLISQSDLTYSLTSDLLQDFEYKQVPYRISLLEDYQIYNALVAIEICFALQEAGWQISPNSIKQGLVETRWPGRFEIMASHPTVIVDGSHNEDGLQALLANLDRYFPEQKRIGIVGMLADKDVDAALAPLTKSFDRLYTVTPDSPRGMVASQMKEKLTEMVSPSTRVIACEDYNQALDLASQVARGDDLIVVFGSFYIVGKFRQLILARRNGEV
ncbi:Folylpolyglutamate synthase [Alloiococcus otitis]|uniref:tetrahydrofolate synthase n=1 Tax=Alloiococcus otitis ATCC 51267 TaxID=883081 RepID=K9EAS9_9LACT|nr:folylpolyglutamate synthase/dihydrofolate synthase family protein [Alloiococcus otitis]EKU92926.1 FolC protein [Alloiococcus otitis ATCC 51267]SUU80437.1 Folylpolyglutamate synthase [Alloiococcus otitis]